MNNNNIDNVIKDSLTKRLDSIELREEVYTRIQANLSNPEMRNQYRNHKRYNTINYFKPIAGFMCVIIILCSLSLMVFPQARVLASNTINTIKTIFVFNGDEIVKVGQEDPILNDGYTNGMSSNLSDSEISEKIGYQVVIPSSLSDEFHLFSKQIVLHLGEPVSYETNERIRPICEKATVDDIELEKLKEFNPSRSISGFYSNPDGVIYVNVRKAVDEYNEYIEYLRKSDMHYKEIKIGDSNGYWVQREKAVYPDGNMTQNPLEIINTFNVYWVNNDLLYYMGTDIHMNTNRLNLDPEMAVRIAESFMAGQKQD